MTSPESNGRLSISEDRVRNLLYEMKDSLLRDLDTKFALKADREAVEALATAVLGYGERLKQIEDEALIAGGAKKFRRYIGTIGVGILAGAWWLPDAVNHFLHQ